MIFDTIVFNQNELDNALKSGISSIALCDNDFILPFSPNISYTTIGSVNAIIDMTKEDFYTSSASSYFLSSYFMTSYRYRYEYEYSTGTSFSSSYATSYSASYADSYVSSYQTSYTSSYSNLSALSLLSAEESETQEGKCIMVNGYGINLI